MKLNDHNGSPLTEQEAFETAQDLLQSPLEEQVAFLHQFHQHSYTADEIVGFAKVFTGDIAKEYDFCNNRIFGIAGTGGDRMNTFNISTATAILLAASGMSIAKYGNRAVTSSSGSADVLDVLGISYDFIDRAAKAMLEKANIVFLSASSNPAFQKVAAARKLVPHPTIVNIIGPLTNPIARHYAMIGVYDKQLLTPMAEAMQRLGHYNSMVVCGGGLDEISLFKNTYTVEVDPESLRKNVINPQQLRMHHGKLYKLQVQSPQESAAMILDVFQGKKGSPRDIVLLNAAAARHHYIGLDEENCGSISEELDVLRTCIDSGRAFEKLAIIQAYSKRFKSA